MTESQRIRGPWVLDLRLFYRALKSGTYRHPARKYPSRPWKFHYLFLIWGRAVDRRQLAVPGMRHLMIPKFAMFTTLLVQFPKKAPAK